MRTPVLFWTPHRSPAESRIRDQHRDEPDRNQRPATPRPIVAVIAGPRLGYGR